MKLRAWINYGSNAKKECRTAFCSVSVSYPQIHSNVQWKHSVCRNLYSYIYYSLYWPDVDLLGLLINRRTPLFILNGDTICPSLCPLSAFFFFFLSPLLNFESLAKQRWTAWWPCRLLGTTSWCCLGVQGRTPASVILLPGVWLNQRKCFYK